MPAEVRPWRCPRHILQFFYHFHHCTTYFSRIQCLRWRTESIGTGIGPQGKLRTGTRNPDISITLLFDSGSYYFPSCWIGIWTSSRNNTSSKSWRKQLWVPIIIQRFSSNLVHQSTRFSLQDSWSRWHWKTWLSIGVARRSRTGLG